MFCPGNCPGRMRMGSCPGWGFAWAHGWGFAWAHGWGFARTHGYGRVFPSKTLRNVPAFAQAFAQAYARANARAKAKGGGVMGVIWVWHGCDLYVLPRQLPGQNENGLLSWMGFCPGTWMGFRPGT